MLVNDLSYLEDVSECQLILGSAGVMVNAEAVALGKSTATLTKANTQARLLPSGVSVARGIGFARAEGEVTSTEVTVAGAGDIVVSNTRTTPDSSKSFGVVVAVDLPKP
ncbi:hypothetical protein [Calothrix sp. NIES-3974]|uniref:hypothetical protein n=1 Tax=Calothrix sp. NIES-3974 TaxID=2005462 RepID=UPI000B604E23|nr:hypothetical protein [Calothrix sp. NIES-3974]BAZ05413.1 hypothetical protein NIES3974_20610 [Calothrix sp. NIES-3974]